MPAPLRLGQVLSLYTHTVDMAGHIHGFSLDVSLLHLQVIALNVTVHDCVVALVLQCL